MKNVTFYEKNVIDSSSSTFACTTADETTAENAFDGDRNTKLISSGSTNGNPEVFEITFAAAVSFNRIFIGGHNILNGEVLYDSGSGYVGFSVPVKLSQNSETSNYFEFDTVSGVDSIKITIDLCIGYADEKYISEIIAFTELGTFSKNPVSYSMPVFEDDSRIHELSDGGNFKVLFGSKFHSTLIFNNMTTADMALTRLIKDRIDPFYVYPYPNQTIMTVPTEKIGFIFYDGSSSRIGFSDEDRPSFHSYLSPGDVVTISGTKINGDFLITSTKIRESIINFGEINHWGIDLSGVVDPDMCCACSVIYQPSFIGGSYNAVGGLNTDFYGLDKSSVSGLSWMYITGISSHIMAFLDSALAMVGTPTDGESWLVIPSSTCGDTSGMKFIIADNLEGHSIMLSASSVLKYDKQVQAPLREKDLFFVCYINNHSPGIYDDQIIGVGTIIDIELGEV